MRMPMVTLLFALFAYGCGAGAQETGDAARESPTDGHWRPLGRPLLPKPPRKPLRIVAGGQHACVLLSDGNVTCWGANDQGECGFRFSGEGGIAKPANVFGVAAATDVSLGYAHSCAVVGKERQVVCWGDNVHFQLGAEMPLESAAPMAIAAMTGVKQVAAGSDCSCALQELGGVSCWGDCVAWLPPSASAKSLAFPIAPVEADTLGVCHCISSAGGEIWCTGFDAGGCFGDGVEDTFNSSWRPATRVPDVNGVVQLDVPCALTNDGTVYCWGGDSAGQTGRGFTSWTLQTPHAVPDVKAERIASGDAVCAILVDGDLTCWGSGLFDMLGNGPQLDGSTVPQRVNGLHGVNDVAIGMDFVCALLDDASVWCWGRNGAGQLGGATEADSWPYPVQIPL